MPDSSVRASDESSVPSGQPTASKSERRDDPLPKKRIVKSGGLRTLLSLILIVAFLVGGAFVTWLIASLREPPKRAEPQKVVQTVEVFQTESATIQELINAFGTARPMEEVVLSAQVAGEIVETITPLKIGTPVTQAKVTADAQGVSRRTSGDLIARIDPQNYRKKVEQAEDLLQEDQAELNRLQQEKKNLERRLAIAEKNFAAYEKEYQRVEDLVDRGVANASDLTTAELDLRKYEDAMVQLETELALMPQRIKQVEARQQTRRNDLDIAELELRRTSVTSPIDGKLSEINIEKGQYVRVGDPLVTVTNVEEVEIPVGIPLEDYLKIASRISSGNYPSASLSSHSVNEAQWRGEVTRAAPNADPETRTVNVYVVVDNSQFESPLLPGTFVTVQIEGPIHHDVVAIPRGTVIDDHVLLVKDGKVARTPVDRMLDIQTLRLLPPGQISPGELVVLTNLDVLSEGDAVKVSEAGRQTLEEELARTEKPRSRILSE